MMKNRILQLGVMDRLQTTPAGDDLTKLDAETKAVV